MISDIYILTCTILKRFKENQPFHDFVVGAFPSCIDDHLPKFISFKSINYFKSDITDALLEMFITPNFDVIDEVRGSGLEIESGYFHIQLESEEDLTRRTLPEVEFVLQKIHESYSFVSSYHFYLDEYTIRSFVKMHTFESNIEEDEETPFEHLHEYAHLLESILYRGEIPNCYADEVAKNLLLLGRL